MKLQHNSIENKMFDGFIFSITRKDTTILELGLHPSHRITDKIPRNRIYFIENFFAKGIGANRFTSHYFCEKEERFFCSDSIFQYSVFRAFSKKIRAINSQFIECLEFHGISYLYNFM